MITEEQLKDALEKICIKKNDFELHISGKISDTEKTFINIIKNYIMADDYVNAVMVHELVYDIFTKRKIINRLLVEFCENGNLKGFNFAMEQGADIMHADNLAFVTACQHGNLNLVLNMIEIGIKPNNIPRALICAAVNHQKEIIVELIKTELDINLNNSEALRLCASLGHTDMVDFLVQSGANVHALNDRALIMAVNGGHADTVDILLCHGCDPNIWNGYCFKVADNKKGENYDRIRELLWAKKNELETQKIESENDN